MSLTADYFHLLFLINFISPNFQIAIDEVGP